MSSDKLTKENSPARYLENDAEEEKRLNDFCSGKTIASISIAGENDLVLTFTDGSRARISTLGGLEIEELDP